MEKFDGEPIFVLGVPRSGTTLVASMLGGHARVRAPAEPWTMLMLDSLGAVHGLHPAGAELVGRRVSTQFDPAARDALIARLARVCYAALGAEGAAFFVDKTPRNHLIHESLVRLFPEARFVFVLRDPTAVAASMRRAWGGDVASLLESAPGHPLCADFFVGLPRLAEAIAAAPGRARHVVRYEALVASPEAGARAMFRELGIEASDDDLRRAVGLATKAVDREFGAREIAGATAISAPAHPTPEAEFGLAWAAGIRAALGEPTLRALGYATRPNVDADDFAPRLSAASRRVASHLAQRISAMRADQGGERAPPILTDLARWLAANGVVAGAPSFEAMAAGPSYAQALATKDAALREKDAALREKDAALREKDAEVEKLATRIETQRVTQAKISASLAGRALTWAARKVAGLP